MVKKKISKKSKKEEDSEEESEGMDLDDVFGDDEDVEYAPSKPVKIKKKKEEEEDENDFDDEEISIAPAEEQGEVDIKQSKPIGKIKKGDKINVDGLVLEVDSHYVLINHGTTKEMAIELFDVKTDKDYQLRYFDDRVKESIEFYVLEEIVYNKKAIKKIEW